MNILIPMAGAGSRFADAGYTTHKPAIPTTDRRTGRKVPMVVAATLDLPGVREAGTNIIYIDRDFHRDGGVEEEILAHIPGATFLTLDYLTEGQASTCLLARQLIDSDRELLIAGCDNGMIYDHAAFEAAKREADALIFTYRKHHHVLDKPEAYGWVRIEGENRATAMSVKVPLSDEPMNDHAVVATFWFRRGADFVAAADRMIAKNDRINGEFYVDQAMQHAIELGLKVMVFEIERYLGWGTPRDYEDFEKTLAYWRDYCESEEWL